MSLSLTEIETIRVVDPVLENGQKMYSIYQGSSNITGYSYTSNNYSNSACSFSVFPPSQVAIDKSWILNTFVELTFAGTSTTGNLLQVGSNDAPRRFPINTSIANINISLNNQTITQTNNNDVLDAITRYFASDHDNCFLFAGTASKPDQFQEYSDYGTYGANRSELNLYGGSESSHDARSALLGVSINIVSNSPTAAVVRLSFSEPLFCSPLAFSTKSMSQGFTGVTNAQVQISWESQQGNTMWSHSSLGNNITSITANHYAPPVLNLIYLSYPLVSIYPKNTQYPYTKYTRFANQDVTIAGGASTTITLLNQQLGRIPTSFFVYLKRSANTRSYNFTDSFAAITTISVNYNNQTGIMGTYSVPQLYGMCLENDGKFSYPQFTKHQGSVLRVLFGKDIPLDPRDAPGVMGNFQLTITLTVKNPGVNTIVYSPYLVIEDEGLLTNVNGFFTLETGVLSEKDVVKSLSQPSGGCVMMEQKSVKGGDFFSGFKNLYPVIKKLRHNFENIIEDVLDLQPEAKIGGALMNSRELRMKALKNN